jgi:hypothetical protein
MTVETSQNSAPKQDTEDHREQDTQELARSHYARGDRGDRGYAGGRAGLFPAGRPQVTRPAGPIDDGPVAAAV